MSPLLIETQCFPPISYFVAALRAEKLVIEAHENYVKGSFRNRYVIAGPNGLQRLSIPLMGGKHQQQPIQDVQIAQMDEWQNSHWRSLQTAYGKSPFFIHYEEEIKAQIYSPTTTLFTWNWQALVLLQELLGLEIPMEQSTAYAGEIEANVKDGRNKILPKNAAISVDFVPYPQVFQEKNGFLPNLSILDLLFCQGPQAGLLLQRAASV